MCAGAKTTNQTFVIPNLIRNLFFLVIPAKAGIQKNILLEILNQVQDDGGETP